MVHHPTPTRRGYRIRDLMMIAAITMYSRVVRWALVRTAKGRPPTDDSRRLLHELEANQRFVKDSGLGRILHPGRSKISYRQAVPDNSLHIVIDGRRVSAHIDRFSPFAFDEDGTPYYSLSRVARYSLKRILVHNLANMADTAWTLISGTQTRHRCKFCPDRLNLDDGTIEVVTEDDRGWSQRTAA